MRQFLFGVFSLLFFSFTLLNAQAIDNKIVSLVTSSVYEVVVKKPQESNIQYQTPLPTDSLAYEEKEKNYYSVGTAFAIAGGRFVSAAHNFSLHKETQLTDFYIRSNSGELYAIKYVYQYSDEHDFIVFDVENYVSPSYLEFEKSYKINSNIYAVGNALGDGIVIRDGLLTSTTLENDSGEWGWLRFSAPASPGNSGGPILDSSGKVLGVITMKSVNENLNYALPASQLLQFPKNRAIASQKLKYTISLLNNYIKPSFFQSEVILPMRYIDLHKKIKNEFSIWSKQIIEEIKTDWESRTFPYGKGSEDIFLASGLYPFPGIIAQRQDSGWGLFNPQQINRSELDDNGVLKYGQIADFTLFSLQKDREQSAIDLYSNSQILGETILKGIPFYREVADQKIRITSLGEAKEFNYHKDSWGRVWISALWELNYSDSMLAVYVLPVPNGLVGIVKKDSTHAVLNGCIHDFNYITDFVVAPYSGNFENWKEFLSLKELLPNFMRGSSIHYSADILSYSDSLISFSIPNTESQWSAQSQLQLGFSFEFADKNLFLTPKSYIFNDERPVSSTLEIKKVYSPTLFNNVPDSYMKFFNQISNLLYPFNGAIEEKSGQTRGYLVAQNKIYKYYYLLSYSTYRPQDSMLIQNNFRELSKDLFNPQFYTLLAPTDLNETDEPEKVIAKTIEDEVKEETIEDKATEQEEILEELAEVADKIFEEIPKEELAQVPDDTPDEVSPTEPIEEIIDNPIEEQAEQPTEKPTEQPTEKPSNPNEAKEQSSTNNHYDSPFLDALLLEFDVSQYLSSENESLLWD